jgi:hypothetical protein
MDASSCRLIHNCLQDCAPDFAANATKSLGGTDIFPITQRYEAQPPFSDFPS